MNDEREPEPAEELAEESQAELGSDTEPSKILTCMNCMADNDELMLRAVQHNQCWKCGKIVDEFVRFPNGSAHNSGQIDNHSPFARWNQLILVILLLSLMGYIWHLVHQ